MGGLFCVYGSGGTGKTYLWNTIIAKLRSEGKTFVLIVASSGIASILLPGGKTAHSRFKIPIDSDDFSCCNIKQQTLLADLIRRTDLIVWDEAPMLHRNIFEAVDRTFRDLMHDNHHETGQQVFGGKTGLQGGDFRHILLIIPKATREIIVEATITRSPIWKYCQLFSLNINMRLKTNCTDDGTCDRSLSEFSQWILDLGDGKLPGISLHEHDEPNWIKIPDDIIIPLGDDPIEQIVTSTYPDLLARFHDIHYLSERCILAPTNECVDQINAFVISSLPGEAHTYYSSDSISPVSESVENRDILFPTEFLNTLDFSGMPTYKLQLKIGAPIMMIRNINQSIGLCNGTRLIIIQMAKKVIKAKIITGANIGLKVLIPRIVMTSSNTKWPFVLRRKQFPVKICFAMTINKSQGQTLKNVGVYLPRPIFTHGQLYVAVLQATSCDGLRVLIAKKENEPEGYTKYRLP